MRVQAVQISVGPDQLRRGFLTDPLHPGNVVDRVADEGEDVEHAFRGHAPPLLDLLRAQQHRRFPASRRDPLGDARTDELVEVLVRGDDHRFVPARHGGQGETGDQIVRLHALLLQQGDPQRPHQILDDGKLRDELLGQGRPIRLVGREPLVTEGWGRRIEGHRDEARLLRREHGEQGAREPEDRAHVLTVGGEELIPLECEVGSEDQGRAVDEIDLLLHDGTPFPYGPGTCRRSTIVSGTSPLTDRPSRRRSRIKVDDRPQAGPVTSTQRAPGGACARCPSRP